MFKVWESGTLQNSGSQSVIPKPGAIVFSGNLFKIQTHKPHTEPAESEVLILYRTYTSCLTKLST